jgi:hypothetical protein
MSRPRTTPELTSDLATALGVGRCRRAVLTLEVGEYPRLEVEYHVFDTVTESATKKVDGIASRLGNVQFKLRLEPFKS